MRSRKPRGEPPAPESFAEATTGRVVVTSGAWNAFSHFVPQFYVLVQSVAAARFLGPTDMGRQSFIAWAALALIFPWSRGLPDAMLRFAAETLGRGRPADVRGLARWATRIEVAAAATAFAGIAVVGQLRGELRGAWALAGLACATNVTRGIPLSLLRSVHRWRESSMIGVWSGAVTMAATVAVLAAGGGIEGMFAVEALVGLGTTVYARRQARHCVEGLAAESRTDHDLHRRVRRYSLIAAAQGVFTYVVWQRSEFLLLDRYARPADIAVYSVAFGAVVVLGRVIQGFAAVVPGSVATMYGAGELERVRTGFGRAIRLLAFATLPMVALAAATGPALIRLAYGRDYAESGDVLLVLLAAVPAVALYHLGVGLLQGVGRQRAAFAASVLGAVVDLGTAFALVPGHAAIGAAVANGAAQLAAATVVVVAAVRLVGSVPVEGGRLARTATAAAVSNVTAWALVAALPDWYGVLAGGIAGAAVFAGLARALHALPPDDAAWLRRALGSRAGRVVDLVAR